MWAIVQTGYRAKDGSADGTPKVITTRKPAAVCLSRADVDQWIRRLKRWATDGVGQSYHAAMIPTYEAVYVGGLGDREPAPCVPE